MSQQMMVGGRWTKVELHDPAKHPLRVDDVATDGGCGRSWCETCNPTPSARCPFEYEHPAPSPSAKEHVEALAYLLKTKADPKHERDDGGVFEAYDVAEGLTAVQYMLEGGGPTSWATVVRSEDGDVVYVVLQSHWSSDTAAVVLEGREAENVGLRLMQADEGGE